MCLITPGRSTRKETSRATGAVQGRAGHHLRAKTVEFSQEQGGLTSAHDPGPSEGTCPAREGGVATVTGHQIFAGQLTISAPRVKDSSTLLALVSVTHGVRLTAGVGAAPPPPCHFGWRPRGLPIIRAPEKTQIMRRHLQWLEKVNSVSFHHMILNSDTSLKELGD